MRKEVIVKAGTFDRRGRGYRETPRFSPERERSHLEKT